jgi:hypothetical protein
MKILEQLSVSSNEDLSMKSQHVSPVSSFDEQEMSTISSSVFMLIKESKNY